MKKNYLYRNTNRMLLLLGFAVTAWLSSCKDTSPGAVNFANSPALVGFQYAGFNNVPYIGAIFGTPADSVNIEVTLSVHTITQSTPVKVSLVSDPAYVTSYNAANGTSYVALSATNYTIPNGGAITINPGQQYVPLTIHIAGQNIDFTKDNAIGLQLTDASGATIASNLSTAIITLTLKSIYAGTYNASGKRVHPTAGTFTFNYNVAMGTVNKTTIDGNALADLEQDLQLQVNPDNSVTISSTYQPLYTIAGKTNTYDPATRTFTLNMYYNTGAPRLMYETLKYVGP
jgi:hypothetical protein